MTRANNSFWLENTYIGRTSALMHIHMFCSMAKICTNFAEARQFLLEQILRYGICLHFWTLDHDH